MKQRIWEIDYFRGVAIILMTIFHLIVDLKDFHAVPIEYLSGFWYYEGRLSAILFTLLAGISSGLNTNPLRHGLQVFAAALLVSIVTYFFNAEIYVRFGILHLLGVAILISPLLQRLSSRILGVLAAILLVLPLWTDQLRADSGLLLPVGITPSQFVSMDYYPLVPWLAVFLIGIILGRRLYCSKQSRLSQWRGVHHITWLGRHSLLIYLVHQPVLLAVLAICFRLAAVWCSPAR